VQLPRTSTVATIPAEAVAHEQFVTVHSPN
jgi:hypothetical protein